MQDQYIFEGRMSKHLESGGQVEITGDQWLFEDTGGSKRTLAIQWIKQKGLKW